MSDAAADTRADAPALAAAAVIGTTVVVDPTEVSIKLKLINGYNLYGSTLRRVANGSWLISRTNLSSTEVASFWLYQKHTLQKVCTWYILTI